MVEKCSNCGELVDKAHPKDQDYGLQLLDANGWYRFYDFYDCGHCGLLQLYRKNQDDEVELNKKEQARQKMLKQQGGRI